MATENAPEQALHLNSQVPAFVYMMNSSTKWIVTLAHTIAVWSRPQNFLGPFIVVGSIAAVYMTDVLKNLINESRPAGAPFADPGMPSSHSLVSFFAAVAWVSVLEASCGGARKAALVGAAALVAVLRVVCGYHSVAQIAVGAGLGSILGHGWVLLGKALASSNPRLALILAWSCYLGGSAVFIARNMRQWVGQDSRL